ncbi:bifunctional DNA primase/polymerase [Streptomyces sp. NL15-2K]|uniref:bifunctional DNA primase/polymerase n=1 Tax=Streptomyces sp. NL15-2K TaxID=376149 RepID=UPI000FFA1EDC|nr:MULTISPECIES: bifunctional DNA primase/polymerase [Actinomycetes]WKX13011.1 bifunctional DNA primase/polymerase [Kutzneria buriramensis]GCB45668.1 hypothetical protein SNL152K_2959 [Streptomyces sp. NL15-2K]
MTGAKTAVEWLASVAPDPEACRWEWERNPLGVALLPAGKAWDVLILPGGLGYPTLDVLTRILDRPGPVLVDFGDARMGFLVPPGTASRWLGTGIRTAGPGTWIVVPYPGRSTGCVRWLVPPDGSGTLTDPALLELAMHEAAAGPAREEGDQELAGPVSCLGSYSALLTSRRLP